MEKVQEIETFPAAPAQAGVGPDYFRLLADNIDHLAWMADEQGLIFWFNKRWYDYTGTTPEEMIGWGWTKVHHPDHVDRVVEKVKRSWQSGEPWQDTIPLRGQDGTYRWFLSRAQPIRDEKGELLCWLGTNTDITEQNEAERKLRESHEELERRVEKRTEELQHRAEQLSRLTSELTLTEQRERRRLSRILHDDLQQLLVGAKFGLQMLNDQLSENEKEAFDQIDSLLDESIKTSRIMTVELASPILKETGMAGALEWLARWQMKKNRYFTVELDLDPEADTEREDVKTLVFVSVRELLLNVVKHSGVAEAKITLEREGDEFLRVTVSDEGKGFNQEKLAARKRGSGFGLFSIRERMSLLGGSLEIESDKGKGSQFSLIAPVFGESHDSLVADESRGETGPIYPAFLAEEPFGEPSRHATFTNGNKVRLLLVDDHEMITQGLTMLLSAHEDMDVVGRASNGIQALELARKLRPDVVLMDYSLPKMDGVETTRKLRKEMPDIQVIGLSMHEEADCSTEMLAAGAADYLTKGGQTDMLLHSIRRVSTMGLE